jgi:hypothetical protein
MARILSRRFDQLGGGAGFVGVFRAWAMRSCVQFVDIRFDKAERAAQAFQIAQGKVGLPPCLVTWSGAGGLEGAIGCGAGGVKGLVRVMGGAAQRIDRVLMSAGV